MNSRRVLLALVPVNVVAFLLADNWWSRVGAVGIAVGALLGYLAASTDRKGR